MEFGGLEGLCKVDPVLDVIKAPRLVLRVAPQARGLVPAACVWGFGVRPGQGWLEEPRLWEDEIVCAYTSSQKRSK